VDITDPENPVFLGSLHAHDGDRHDAQAATGGGTGHAGASDHRDVKVYEHFALIVSEEAGHGMQVFDLSTLPAADAPDLPRMFAETAHYDRFGNAHNIAVNTQSGFAYAVGSTAGAYPYNGGLHIIDLSDPLNPARAGGYAGDGYTHDVQCVNYRGPDQALAGREICLAANEDTLTVVDVTVKSAPSLVSRTGYPGAAYTHQGWLSEDQRYFFLNDEADEQTTGWRTRTLIWDVADLNAPRLVEQYRAPSTATDHNHYVRGGFLFQSNYTSGLRVLDVRRPEAPLEVGFFDTRPDSEAPVFEGTWSNYPYFSDGLVALSDIDRGLFLLRPAAVSAAAAVDLTVSVDGPAEAASGDTLSFDLSVVNNGPDTASAVELVLSLPRGARFVQQMPTGCEIRDVVTAICRPGDLPAGASHPVVLTATAQGSGRLQAIAFATARADEQDTRDNRRIHEVSVQQPPGRVARSGGGGAGIGLVLGLLGLWGRVCRKQGNHRKHRKTPNKNASV
jgi:choice-of-anchor B domain-containing protein